MNDTQARVFSCSCVRVSSPTVSSMEVTWLGELRVNCHALSDGILKFLWICCWSSLGRDQAFGGFSTSFDDVLDCGRWQGGYFRPGALQVCIVGRVLLTLLCILLLSPFPDPALEDPDPDIRCVGFSKTQVAYRWCRFPDAALGESVSRLKQGMFGCKHSLHLRSGEGPKSCLSALPDAPIRS